MKAHIIEARDIKRSFRSVKKNEGMKGALQLLVKPEYTSHEALKGVSFQIEEGSFVGLIGANGAGKTTLLKILSGLIPPSSGEANVLGYAPFERKLEFRKQIALVMGQKAQLWWDLPAVDAFDLIRAIYEIPRDVYKKRIDELASLLDVTSLLNTQIRRLSLGERMKMELIGALLHWPKVIFLDEPTIGLDVVAAQKLREFLKVFNQREKATIILTSHNMDDIERLCSRVIIIKSGEMIYDGKAQGLLSSGECVLRVQFKGKTTEDEVASIVGLSKEAITRGGDAEEGEDSEATKSDDTPIFLLSLQRSGVVPALQSLLSKREVLDMGIQEQNLESVIQKIYREGLNQ